MTKTFIIFFFLIQNINSFSQKIMLQLHGGLANYQGDLVEKPFTFNNSGGQFGIGIHYAINDKINLRATGSYGAISGSDANSSKAGNRARNLSFKNTIWEFNLGAEYLLFDLEQKKWSPYFFAGIGAFNHNPYTIDQNNKTVYLQPLGTEGQGLAAYPNKKKYNLNQLCIPIGGGFRFAITEKVFAGYELGFRKLFFDYLDDVSDKYPDETKLLLGRGAKAVELSYRGDELLGGSAIFPTENTSRGSAKNKDWYYFQSITIGVKMFTGGNGLFANKNKYGTKCPTRF